METLRKWKEEKRAEFIKVFNDNDIPAEDDLVNRPSKIADWWLSQLPSLTTKLEAEILEMVGEDVEVPLDVTNTDLVHRIANIGLIGESNGQNKEKDRLRTAITTYFKRDI